MLPLKWPITLKLLPFSGHHIGFPVHNILTLNAAFCSRTIFRKSHKDTLLHLSSFQRYAEESGLGGNFTPPPLDIGGLNIYTESNSSTSLDCKLCLHNTLSYVGTGVAG